jgi:hypothetical protein
MFRHISLLRWTDESTPEQRDDVLTALRALPDAIPEIGSYRVGIDAGLAAQGNSDLAIVADFDDVASYVVYRDHPVHQDLIARLILPILASRAAVQHDLD